MLIESILYNHIEITLEVKLKPIFEALRKLKEGYNSDEKVRILKTLIVPNEKGPEGAIFENGTGNATWLQPIVNIVIHELDKMSIGEMLCFA